ncbi:hypothetical protein ACFXKC_31100 [Streptomyces sp. NPDC059340]|uniref:hypothetical protein n=1 Tax=Streptomyces sp. NPDC059340 TaxID=3346806 RepID=UPI0036BD7CF0
MRAPKHGERRDPASGVGQAEWGRRPTPDIFLPGLGALKSQLCRRGLKRFQKHGSRTLFLLMLPGLAYFLVFHYGALLGNVIAFKDYVPFDGVWGSRWVGLDNFRRMFEDAEFWDAVLNTLWIAVLQIVFYFPAPLALALLLHSLTRSSIRRFVQSVAAPPRHSAATPDSSYEGMLAGGRGPQRPPPHPRPHPTMTIMERASSNAPSEEQWGRARQSAAHLVIAVEVEILAHADGVVAPGIRSSEAVPCLVKGICIARDLFERSGSYIVGLRS